MATPLAPTQGTQQTSVAHEFKSRGEDISCLNKPFHNTVKLLRGGSNPDAGCIRKIFNVALGIIAALALTVFTAGIGALLIAREWMIQKQEDAYDSGCRTTTATLDAARDQAYTPNSELHQNSQSRVVQRLISQAINQARQGYVLESTIQERVTNQVAETVRNNYTHNDNVQQQINAAVSEAAAPFDGFISPADHQQAVDALQQDVNALSTRVDMTQEQHEQAVNDAVANAVNPLQQQVDALSTRVDMTQEQYEQAVNDAVANAVDPLQQQVNALSGRVNMTQEQHEQAVLAKAEQLKNELMAYVPADNKDQAEQTFEDVMKAQVNL